MLPKEKRILPTVDLKRKHTSDLGVLKLTIGNEHLVNLQFCNTHANHLFLKCHSCKNRYV